MGSETVTVCYCCKILGIEFANSMKGRAQQHFNAMTKHVGFKRRISHETMIKLNFQVYSAGRLYAAPVRAQRSTCNLHTTNSKIVKQALVVPTQNSNHVAEVLAGKPPLDPCCKKLTASFLEEVTQ